MKEWYSLAELAKIVHRSRASLTMHAKNGWLKAEKSAGTKGWIVKGRDAQKWASKYCRKRDIKEFEEPLPPLPVLQAPGPATKIRIFLDPDPEKLETSVNEWLEKHSREIIFKQGIPSQKFNSNGTHAMVFTVVYTLLK